MNSIIVNKLLFPIKDLGLNKEEKLIYNLKYLNKTQWYSLKEIKKIQEKRLRSLINHAYHNVPYYHNLFRELKLKPDDFKNIQNIKKIPILTKDTIVKNFDQLKAINFSSKKFINSSTGGSTGKPLNFLIDRSWSANNMAAAYRSWSWAGYYLGDKMAFLWGSSKELGRIKRNKLKNFDRVMRIKRFNAFDLTDKKMERYTQNLKKFNPKFINSYSSAIYSLSQFLLNEGISDLYPKSILTTADMLYKFKRKTIEDAFNCKVFDYYSSRETSFQAAECKEHNGYHMSLENAFIEFLKNNLPVNSNEKGKIIVTDLCNFSMPFIRYEIGDLGVPSDELCSCGRKLPLMKSIEGRILDIIVTPRGKKIPGEFFPSIFATYHIKGIKNYQIIQNDKYNLVINIVKREDFNQNTFDFLTNIIKENIGEDMNLDINFVEKIDIPSSGKRRPVISKVRSGAYK